MMNKLRRLNHIRTNQLEIDTTRENHTVMKNNQPHLHNKHQVLHHRHSSGKGGSSEEPADSGDSSSSLDTIVERATEGSYVLDSGGQRNEAISPYLDIQVAGFPLGPTGSALALEKLKRTQSFKESDQEPEARMTKGLRRQAPIVLRKNVESDHNSPAPVINQDIHEKSYHEEDKATQMLTLTVPDINVKALDKDDGYDSPSTFNSDMTSSTNTSIMTSPGTQQPNTLALSRPERPDTLPGLDSSNLEHERKPTTIAINKGPHCGYSGTSCKADSIRLSPDSHISNHMDSKSACHWNTFNHQDHWERKGQSYREWDRPSSEQPGGLQLLKQHTGTTYTNCEQKMGGIDQTQTAISDSVRSPCLDVHSDVVPHSAIKTEYGYIETNKIPGFKAMNNQLRKSVRKTKDLSPKSNSRVSTKHGGSSEPKSVEDKLKDLVLWSEDAWNGDIDNGNMIVRSQKGNNPPIGEMSQSWEGRGAVALMDIDRPRDIILGKHEKDSSVSNNNSLPGVEIANNNCGINQYVHANQSSANYYGLRGQSSRASELTCDDSENKNIQVACGRLEYTPPLNRFQDSMNNSNKIAHGNQVRTYKWKTEAERHSVENIETNNVYSDNDYSLTNGNKHCEHNVTETRYQSRMTQPHPDNAYNNKRINPTPVTSHSTQPFTFNERGPIDFIPRDQSQATAVPRKEAQEGGVGEITASGSIHYSKGNLIHRVNEAGDLPEDKAIRQGTEDLTSYNKEGSLVSLNNKTVVQSNWGKYTAYPPLRSIGSPTGHKQSAYGNNVTIHDVTSEHNSDHWNPQTANRETLLDTSENPSSKKVRFQLDLYGNMQHTTHYINKETHSPIDCPNQLYHSTVFNTKAPTTNSNSAPSQNDLNKVSVSDQSHKELSQDQINIGRQQCRSDTYSQEGQSPAIKIRTLADIKPVPAKLVISQHIPTTSSQTVCLDLVHSFTTSTAVAAKQAMGKVQADQRQVAYPERHYATTSTNFAVVNQGEVSRNDSLGTNSASHSKLNNRTYHSSPDQWRDRTTSLSKEKHVYMRNFSCHRGNEDFREMHRNVVQVNNFRESVVQEEERRPNSSHIVRTDSKRESLANKFVTESHSGLDPTIHNGWQRQNNHFRSSNETQTAAPIRNTERMFSDTSNITKDTTDAHTWNINCSANNRLEQKRPYQDESNAKENAVKGQKGSLNKQPPSYEEHIRKRHNPSHLESDVHDRDLKTFCAFQRNNRLRSSMSDPNIAEWLQQTSHTYKYNNLLSKSSTTLDSQDLVSDLQIVSIEQRRMESFRSQKGPVYATTCEIYQMLASRRGNPLAMKSPYYKHFAESSL